MLCNHALNPPHRRSKLLLQPFVIVNVLASRHTCALSAVLDIMMKIQSPGAVKKPEMQAALQSDIQQTAFPVTSILATPSILALTKSGTCVVEWLPQMHMLVTEV